MHGLPDKQSRRPINTPSEPPPAFTAAIVFIMKSEGNSAGLNEMPSLTGPDCELISTNLFDSKTQSLRQISATRAHH